MSDPNAQPPALEPRFVRHTLFAFAVGAALFLGWQLASVALLAFGGVVVAVLLRVIADPLRARTRLNDGAALLAAGLVVLAALTGAGWLFRSVLMGQLASLAAQVPTSAAALQADAARLPFGAQAIDWLGASGGGAGPFSGIAGRLGGYALTALGLAGNLVVVVFAGIFLAIRPQRTRDGLLALLPQGPRRPARRALDASGRALKAWMVGVLIDMTAVGLMTGLGAWGLGLPSPFALGVIAAVADFVPFVGPVAGAIPGVLVALPQGLAITAWTVGLYVAVQQIEGNVIFPFVQRRAVDLPPALSILAVVAFGVLFGPAGVVLATPLLVVLYTSVKLLYVHDTREDPADAPRPAAP